MQGLKLLSVSGLLLALLTTSALAYMVAPNFDGEQDLNEVQQQAAFSMESDTDDGMIQDTELEHEPDEAEVQGGVCDKMYLYVLAFTSGVKNAGSDNSAYIVVELQDSRKGIVKLYDRVGNDYYPNKGDLWKIQASAFKLILHRQHCAFKLWGRCHHIPIPRCFEKNDIKSVTLVTGGKDGWNIDSVVTYLRINDNYQVLSQNFNVFRWLDADNTPSHSKFPLTIVRETNAGKQCV